MIMTVIVLDDELPRGVGDPRTRRPCHPFVPYLATLSAYTSRRARSTPRHTIENCLLCFAPVKHSIHTYHVIVDIHDHEVSLADHASGGALGVERFSRDRFRLGPSSSSSPPSPSSPSPTPERSRRLNPTFSLAWTSYWVLRSGRCRPCSFERDTGTSRCVYTFTS